MPSTILGKALLAGCALILGGCQVAGTPGLSRTGTAAEQRQARTETEQGREHLSAQRNGLAIEAFNRALVFGEEPAPALNGLGVAYARLGRADLAYRFFSQAAAADPASAVYSRNLAMLTSSPAFTLAAIRTPRPIRVAADAQRTTPRQSGKLYRQDGRQVSLVTAVPALLETHCGVTFKGARQAACALPAVPTVAARNKVKAETAGTAGPAGSTRKVVHFDTAGALPIVIARP